MTSLRFAVSIALLAAALLTPTRGWSYSFVLDPLEFASWPSYCQARYVTTGIGSTTQFAEVVSPAAIEAARSVIGAQAFEHIHHYCAGLLYLRRARTEADPRRKKWLLEEAFRESAYTYNRVVAGSPIHATIATTLAQIEKTRGNNANALQFLEAARSASPTDPLTHLALAIFHRDAGRLADARTVLEEGFAATERKSYEIAYNLGLICMEMKDINCAVENARFVYDAGFPLPGLKNRLEQAGHWPR